MKLRERLPRIGRPELMPLWIAVFIDVLGFSILVPLLPHFSEQYGAPDWQVGLLLSTNALFSFFSGPLWGRLSDRYGRKPMLLISQAGTLAGFLMLAFSQDLTMLFLSRVVDGIFGGNFPIAKAVIGDVVPPQERSVQMSNIGAAYVLSSLVGPALGGLLYPWGIIAPGLLSSALTCLTITVTLLFLKESNPSAHHAASGAAAPANRKAEVLKNPLARRLLLQWGFHTLSFTIFTSCVSLFAKSQLDMAPPEIGVLMTISGAIRLLIRFTVFIPMLKRLGERATSLVGLGIFVITYALLGLVRTPLQFGLIQCASSFAAACTRGVLTGFLSRSVQQWEQGQAMGFSASIDSFAQITGPIIGGFTLDYLHPWVYGGIASVVALGALALGLTQREIPYETGCVAETP